MSFDKTKEMYNHIDNGDWDSAIATAKQIPAHHDIWQQMPSAGKMPDHAVHKVLDHLLKNPKQKDNLNSFMFELASNLPEDMSNETLSRLATMDDSGYTQKLIRQHPNFGHSGKDKDLKNASDWWNNYERSVKPEHFATIKSMYTGKPEHVRDHRGNHGSSHEHVHLIPSLKDHAAEIQKKVLADPSIKQRQYNGKPYVKVYRGIGGAYAKTLKDASEYSASDNSVKNKTLNLPTAHLTSWTTDPEMAARFAWGRGNIDMDNNENHGVVLEQWLPAEDILHSGFHNSTFSVDHPHPDEQELVFGHPEGKIKIKTSKMKFTPEGKENDFGSNEYGKIIKPNVKKAESNYNSGDLKNKFIAAATAFAMAGIPHATSTTDQVNELKQTPIQDVAEHSPDDKQLDVIATIESTGGKNVKHPVVKFGPHAGTSAVGKYGLMPMQIVDTINYDKNLKKKYPMIAALHYKNDQARIKGFLDHNPKAEKDIVSSHWRRLAHRFDGNMNKMAFAWNQGITGALKADDAVINNHDYVKKFNKIKKLKDLERIQKLKLKKSEDMQQQPPISKFIPFTGTEVERSQIEQINDLIFHGKITGLDDTGHFTKDSFVLGDDQNKAWLLKVEQPKKSAIKSAKYGLQTVKEVAFYEIAKEVMKLGDYVPMAILGESIVEDKRKPTAAIKMLPSDFISGSSYKKVNKEGFKSLIENMTQKGDTHKLAAMLYVLGDLDAHGGNLLTNGNEIKLIDHGTSFANETMDVLDDKIYVPYILRQGGFKDNMTTEEKVAVMPKVKSESVKEEIIHWILTIDHNKLRDLLNNFEIDPKAIEGRLRKLQSYAVAAKNGSEMGIDDFINRVWVDPRC